MSSQSKIILLISLVCGLAMPAKAEFTDYAVPVIKGICDWKTTAVVSTGTLWLLKKRIEKAYAETNEAQKKVAELKKEPIKDLTLKEFVMSRDFPLTSTYIWLISNGYLWWLQSKSYNNNIDAASRDFGLAVGLMGFCACLERGYDELKKQGWIQ